VRGAQSALLAQLGPAGKLRYSRLKKYGLFKNDLEKDLTLNQFTQDVDFFISLAAKELQRAPPASFFDQKRRLPQSEA